MNLTDLQNVVAAYHQKSPADLTINGTDMFLLTANNVRRQAELLHNFEYSRCQVSLGIDGVTGGALNSATFVEPLTGGPVIRSVTDGVTNGTTTVTSATANFTSADLGRVITGTDIPDGTTITLVPNTTHISISQTATGSHTGVTLSILDKPFAAIKEVVALQRRLANGALVPVDFSRSDIPIERDRATNELSDFAWPAYRYPSDAQLLLVGAKLHATVVQRRNRLFIYPAPVSTTELPITVIIEAFGFLYDYVDATYDVADPPDYFFEFGFNWLKWSIIMELNPLFSTFVPRQEGNVANTYKDLKDFRDDAWQQFMEWDSYMIDNNATRSR